MAVGRCVTGLEPDHEDVVQERRRSHRTGSGAEQRGRPVKSRRIDADGSRLCTLIFQQASARFALRAAECA